MALVVAPFLSFAPSVPVAEAKIQPTPRDLPYVCYNVHERIPVYPKFYATLPSSSDKDDPLGQYGFVSIKYEVNGNTYGDYMKISDDIPLNGQILEECKALLLEYSEKKLNLINPNAYFIQGVPNVYIC